MGGRGAKSASGLASAATGSSAVGLTEEEISRLCDKWGTTSKPYRKALAGNPKYAGVLEDARAFDGYLDAGEYKGTLYRGVRSNKARRDGIAVGDTIDMSGPSSWSTDESVAREFAGNGHAEWDEFPTVYVMSGGTRHGRDISGRTGIEEEHEVGVSSSSKTRVTKIKKATKKNPVTYVYVEET